MPLASVTTSEADEEDLAQPIEETGVAVLPESLEDAAEEDEEEEDDELEDAAEEDEEEEDEEELGCVTEELGADGGKTLEAQVASDDPAASRLVTREEVQALLAPSDGASGNATLEIDVPTPTDDSEADSIPVSEFVLDPSERDEWIEEDAEKTWR
jgi:histone chaperone ASF1